jgi:Tat protein secretion system quality control protein TatD with DNase activity
MVLIKKKIAEDLLANNFYLSFGKAVLYNLSLQDILKNTPLDKIFLKLTMKILKSKNCMESF